MTKKLTPEEKAANLAARRAARGGVAGKPKAAKAAKAGKKAKTSKVTPLRSAKASTPGEGHNSGQINEELKDYFVQLHKLDDDKKAITQAAADIKAAIKEKFNLSKENIAYELKMQKKEQAARVQFEATAIDLKKMLGIQLALNLPEPDEEDGDNAPDPLEAGSRAAAVH